MSTPVATQIPGSDGKDNMVIVSKTDNVDAMSRSPTKSTEVEDGTLVEFGYDPAYRRVFRSVGNMCMVISLTSPLGALTVTAAYQITYGGYWGLTWGWIIPAVLSIPMVLCVAELASAMPVNGAFYWWSGALAPVGYAHIVSFVSGWMNVLSTFSATAAFVYAVASFVSFSVEILLPTFAFSNAEMMAVSIAVLCCWALCMCLRIENIAMIYFVTSGIVLLETFVMIFGLPIAYRVQGNSFASASDVFGSYQNYSGWSAGIAVPYTWFASMWVNSAWMCPCYVAEETKHASKEIPKSVILTYSVTAVSGILICVLWAFCITDIEASGTDQSDYPIVTLMVNIWGPTLSGVFFIVGLPIGLFGGSGTLVTYSAQLAAFARDGGLPWKEKFATVHPRLNQPVYTTGLLVLGTSAILLFALSEEASSIIYSLSVVTGLATFNISYVMRVIAGDRWVPGPFSLGRWSWLNAVLAVAFTSYMMIMECFPAYPDYTLASMNWNSVLTAGSFIFSLGLYYVIGKSFDGPDQEALASWRAARVE